MTTHRVALVTGARRGIGRAIALTLASEGYDIAVNDYEIDANAEQTAVEIRALGRQAQLVQADLGDTASTRALIQQVVEHFGQIDVLVNNAATWAHEAFVDISEVNWDKVIAVDLKGPFVCSQTAAQQMIKQGSGGAIVNISSVHRVRCWPNDTVYGIVKAGIVRLTESMAFELGQYGIRVNAIAPGYIDSRTLGVPANPNEPPIGQPDYAARVAPITPMRRIGVPDDIATATAFLVSERASFITGQCLTVDGGFLLGVASVSE